MEHLKKKLIRKKKSGPFGILSKKLAYTSNGLEGNQLSEGQVATMFELDFLFPSANKINPKDYTDMDSHFEAFSRLVDRLDEPVDADMVLSWYKAFDPSADADVSFDWPAVTSLSDLARAHIAFLRLSPLPAWNGQFARLLLMKECLLNGWVPFVIPVEKKAAYDRLVSSGNVTGLADFFSDCQEETPKWLGKRWLR